jgi:hypothetical protein
LAQEEFEHAVKRDVEARLREGVKALLEEVRQEEMTVHLKAGFQTLLPLAAASATATTGAPWLRQRTR